MKVMAFVGSPRKGGNTDILIDKVIKGAKSKTEVEVEKIYLYDANIKYCTGCGTHTVLKGSKECPLNDDMKGILKRMEQVDAFIFGVARNVMFGARLNRITELSEMVEKYGEYPIRMD